MRKDILLTGIVIGLIINIKSHAQQNELRPKILAQLNLKEEDCKEDLIREKQLPYDTELSVWVTPHIASMGDYNFSLAQNQTGKIINHFYETKQKPGLLCVYYHSFLVVTGKKETTARIKRGMAKHLPVPDFIHS